MSRETRQVWYLQNYTTSHSKGQSNAYLQPSQQCHLTNRQNLDHVF